MANEKRRTKVVINGKEYTIVGEKSSAHIELVAETLNKQLADLNKLSTKLSKEEQAILVAVNAVSSEIESHQKVLQLEEKIKELEN
ncbi:MAG TPA: cell division protein ZapA [Atopostipes sp.]|nr:cell division protein ZapA [Atopostipes sp.]